MVIAAKSARIILIEEVSCRVIALKASCIITDHAIADTANFTIGDTILINKCEQPIIDIASFAATAVVIEIVVPGLKTSLAMTRITHLAIILSALEAILC